MNAESWPIPANLEENPNRFQKTSQKLLSIAVVIFSHVKQSSSKNFPHYIICLKRKY